MSDTPAKVGRPAGEAAVGIDAEVEAKFIEGLRRFGTPHSAARFARPHLAERGSKRCSYGAFRKHSRRNPAFAEACADALSEYQGAMEAVAHKRAMTVDRKPTFNPRTGEMVLCEDRRNANDMLKLILSRIDPDAWAPKKHLQVQGQINHTGTAALTSGANWLLKADDILLLTDPDEQRQLIDLLSKIEELRQAQQPAKPVQAYAVFPGPVDDAPAALPAPENTNG